MIGYFPEPYPDELVYSLLARYCAKSGYLGYVCAAEDIFQNTWNLPNIEFLNEYKPEVYQRLEKNTGMRHIVMEHTMFPVYGRFLPKERRQAAYNALLLGKGNYHNLLPQNKWKQNDRYLRYCPVCVKADREKYGETFWHRIHQIYGLNICPKHLCRLYDSSVPIKSKATPALFTAEESYREQDIEYSEIFSERNLATYVYAMMMQPIDLLSVGTAGDYLQSVIAETDYSSPRGEHRYMTKLFSDFEQYYMGLPENRLTKPWALQKLLCNKRVSFVEICMMAHFLDVMPVDLAEMKIPKISHKDAFDAKVRELHEKGLKYPEIARRMNASLDVVKPVGEGRYPKGDPNKVRVNRGGVKSYNWEKIDLEMLPNSVFLDGDWCWDADPFQVTEETKAMVMRNICFLLNSFLHCTAYENIIFCWVMHEQSIIDEIIDRLDTGDARVIKISLMIDETNLRKRLSADIARGIRSNDVIDRSVARIDMYQTLDTIKVDTVNKNVYEIVSEILTL